MCVPRSILFSSLDMFFFHCLYFLGHHYSLSKFHFTFLSFLKDIGKDIIQLHKSVLKKKIWERESHMKPLEIGTIEQSQQLKSLAALWDNWSLCCSTHIRLLTTFSSSTCRQLNVASVTCIHMGRITYKHTKQLYKNLKAMASQCQVFSPEIMSLCVCVCVLHM